MPRTSRTRWAGGNPHLMTGMMIWILLDVNSLVRFFRGRFETQNQLFRMTLGCRVSRPRAEKYSSKSFPQFDLRVPRFLRFLQGAGCAVSLMPSVLSRFV